MKPSFARSLFPLRLPFALALLGFLGGMEASPCLAAFLDFSLPAREAALGGNGVALPEGTSCLTFNPAGLGEESLFKISARYEDLFAGIEGDNLSTGNLSAAFPLPEGDGFGVSLDHFGSNNLSQDRLLAAFGKSFQAHSFLRNLKLGLSLSFLRQQFTLTAPLAGVNASSLSAGDFSVGAGALYDLRPWLTLGFSVEDLNQPNVGVVGVDRVPSFWRWGVALKPQMEDDRLSLTLSQALSGNQYETQGGGEWVFGRWGTAVRVGVESNMAAIGLGWRGSGLTVDYAYQFSWNQAPSLSGTGLPGSHLLEVGFTWEGSSRDKKVLEDLLYKAGQALQDHQWKDAYWYYQQAYLLKPEEPAVLQGREKALGQYNGQRADYYFKEGQKLEEEGYFREAQKNYDWAASLAPGESQYPEARERVKKSLTQGALSDPGVQKILENSVSLLKKGEQEKALKEIQKAKTLYPDDTFLAFLAKTLSKKTARHPEDKEVEGLTMEAEIYRSKGRMDLARDTWQRILKADPANALAKDNLVQRDSDQSESALSEPDRIRSQALLEKGLKAYAKGDLETAAQLWEEVLKIDPGNVNALNNLTRARMEQGKNPE